MSVYSEEPPFRAIGAGRGRMGVKCVLGGGRLLHIFCSFFFFFNFFFTQGILILSQILKCKSVKAKKKSVKCPNAFLVILCSVDLPFN